MPLQALLKVKIYQSHESSIFTTPTQDDIPLSYSFHVKANFILTQQVMNHPMSNDLSIVPPLSQSHLPLANS